MQKKKRCKRKKDAKEKKTQMKKDTKEKKMQKKKDTKEKKGAKGKKGGKLLFFSRKQASCARKGS